MNQNKDRQHRSLTARGGLKLRAAEDGKQSRTIEGYAVCFGVESEKFYEDESVTIREVIDSSAIDMDLLNRSDVKMTLFHDDTLLLARSENGQGTLGYEIDETGVKFRFDAPSTVDGDKALELVKRGDLWGCSFAFTTHYGDKDFVERSVMVDEDGHKSITYRVKRMTGVYDFSIVGNPAYRDTSVALRHLGVNMQENPAITDVEHSPSVDETKRDKLKRQYDELTEIINTKLI